MKFLNLFTAVLAGSTLFCAKAEEVIFQSGRDNYEGMDGVMIQGEPEALRRKNFYGAVQWQISGVAWGGPKRLVLLRFTDLVGEGRLPEQATIMSAYLELYKIRSLEDQGQYKNDSSIDVFLLKTPFFPEESTFDERSSLQAEFQYWGDRNTIEDGPVANIDYSKEDQTSRAPLRVEGEGVWMRWDLREMVAQWINAPESNHGILLQANAYWIGGVFASHLHEDNSLRPRLVIKYSIRKH